MLAAGPDLRHDPFMSASLAPGLLVAMPDLRDPDFFRGVVMLCAHTTEGAFGLVINHTLDIGVAAICAEAGVDWPHRESPAAYCGGPVERQRGWVVHDAAQRFPDTQYVHDGLALSASREALKAYAQDPGGRYRLVLGYSGWGAAQLEEEMASGSWLTAELKAAAVFSTAPVHLWKETLAGLGVHEPSQLVSGSTRIH